MKKLLTVCLVLALALAFGGCAAKQTQSSNEDSKWESVQVEFDAEDYYSRLESCVKQIREKTDFVPEIALVLGSGLGDYADSVKIISEIPYSEIKGFPVSTVAGHDGTLIFCEIKGKKVVVMNGRVHYYEGYDIHEVVLPLRVIHLLGAKTVVLTNAVGAINADYSVGDFVLNVDYISSFVPSPLVGENIDKLGDRFVDMTNAFDTELNSVVEDIAKQNKIPVHKGVMVQVTGPQYESPTEIKMYRSLGADTVGMSTVVETIAARHMGMRVCSISCITNMAAGMQEKISHEEVQNSSNNSSKNFAVLVGGLLEKMK
ncbi:MAG TPA: purine-nucleoside phosphorylase [Ruminococcaceae bacterium]|nr:purine-nucleoside phosphorylase [Oscillospiraceae bacterium]